MPGDVDFASVSTLLHFDGGNTSTIITDSSGSPKTFTAVGAANLTTTKSRFGGACLDLSSGGYVQCPASSDFAFGTGDFTIEFWAWKSANDPGGDDTACTTDTSDGSAVDGWFVELSTSRGFLMASASALAITYGSAAPNDSTWHHWAVARAGTTLRLFKDGYVVAIAAHSGNIAGSGKFGVGRNDVSFSYPFNGYIDELRITKGIARYTADFTPPTESFPGAVASYALSGTVTGSTGSPAARAIRAQREDTGAYVGGTISNATTGAYTIPTDHSGEHTVVAYPVTGENLPALVHHGVIPI